MLLPSLASRNGSGDHLLLLPSSSSSMSSPQRRPYLYLMVILVTFSLVMSAVGTYQMALSLDPQGGGAIPPPMAATTTLIEEETKPERTVGVVVTFTECKRGMTDALPVLQYSIMRQQKLRRLLGSPSRYGYHFYVIYHPMAKMCVKPLADLNFTLLERESPVLPHEIRGEHLRTTIAKSGCCGEKELLKFEAFTLTQHDAVIMLDVDTLVLNSLDGAMDLLLDRTVPPDASSHLMYPNLPIPDDIWILHTIGYAGAAFPDQEIKPSQGGFLILKPNRTIYSEIMDIVREGQFGEFWGWGTEKGPNTGWFYGVKTYQGLIPYYFQILHPGHVVEMNWCRYNQMNLHPKYVNIDPDTNVTTERCFTNRDECEDCRERKLEDTTSIHFSECTKPWEHRFEEVSPDKVQLCRQMHQAWLDCRNEMEISWGRRPRRESPSVVYSNGTAPEDEYELIRQPFGRAIIE